MKIEKDSNSLAHTKWNCKYHIVFAPKYRRKVFYNEKRAEIREILRKLCEWKGVEIIEGEVCPNYMHIMVSIAPKMSVLGFMHLYVACRDRATPENVKPPARRVDTY